MAEGRTFKLPFSEKNIMCSFYTASSGDAVVEAEAGLEIRKGRFEAPSCSQLARTLQGCFYWSH